MTCGGGLSVQLMALHGDAPMTACENCVLGFKPNRVQGSPINWSMDRKSVFVSLHYFGLGTAKTVVLPYRSGVPLAALWPKGLRYEQDVARDATGAPRPQERQHHHALLRGRAAGAAGSDGIHRDRQPARIACADAAQAQNGMSDTAP